MKAIRIHGPMDGRYEDVPDPQAGPDDVLVRVRAAGICGTDVEIFDGTAFYVRTGRQSLPMTPGHEWAGEVVETGANVRGFRAGDRVTGECSVGCRKCEMCLRGWYNQCRNLQETGILGRAGGFAEYIAFPTTFLHKCNDLVFEHAALVEPTGIALYPPILAKVTPADYVAVVGPGPIGLLAVQTAKAHGARKVVLVGRSGPRLEVGRSIGADAVINIREEDLRTRMAAETGGNMADVVIEAAGTPEAWDQIAQILAVRARVAMTGLFAGKKCQVDFDPLVINQVTIMGSLGAPGHWDEAIDLISRGKVNVAPLITHRLPLREFARGVEIMKKRIDNAIKVILTP